MILIQPDGMLKEPENDVALDLIKPGGAALNLDQPSPPFAIIKLLEVLAGDIARLGSSQAKLDKLDEVKEKLFKDQIKQKLVGGRTVSWWSLTKLAQELFDRLFRPGHGIDKTYGRPSLDALRPVMLTLGAELDKRCRS